MITITSENYVPFQSIFPASNHDEVPDAVFYPGLFGGEIAKIVLRELARSPEEMTWLADDPEWKTGIHPFVRCIEIGVRRVTNQEFDRCLVTRRDPNGLKRGPNVVFVSFGDVRSLQLRNVSRGEKVALKGGSGSMTVMRDGAWRHWSYEIERKPNALYFTMVFYTADRGGAEAVPTDGPLQTTYLSADERKALVSKIRASMADVAQVHGEQCVDGPNPTLLRHLEMRKLLGRGSFGSVYLGCAPRPCGDDAYNFAVKVVSMSRAEFKFPFASNKQIWHEPYILRKMINPLVENGRSPNLPLLAESYTCSSCDGSKPCFIMLMELATGGDMKGWFDTKPREDEVYSALFQTMAGVHAIHTHGQIQNNDIKAMNTLVYNVVPGGYWHYVIRGRDFYVPNFGKLFVLTDFGVSRVFDPKHRLVTNKADKWVTLGKRYAMIIDGKYSPLKAKRTFTSGKPSAPRFVGWGHQEEGAWVRVSTSSGGIAEISYDGKRIHDPEIEFTPEQRRELNRLGIPADSGRKEFYEHPEVIPPMDLRGDTQDAIRIFTGGKRATQPEDHPRPEAVTGTILEQLLPYAIPDFRAYNDTVTNDDVTKTVAGHFLLDFFTRNKDYTALPAGGRIINTYRIGKEKTNSG